MLPRLAAETRSAATRVSVVGPILAQPRVANLTTERAVRAALRNIEAKRQMFRRQRMIRIEAR